MDGAIGKTLQIGSTPYQTLRHVALRAESSGAAGSPLRSARFIQSRKVSAVQPILAEIHQSAAHCEGYSPW